MLPQDFTMMQLTQSFNEGDQGALKHCALERPEIKKIFNERSRNNTLSVYKQLKWNH